MKFCPVCKSELSLDADVCPICNLEIKNHDGSKWVQIGSIEDQMSSDYAEETLKSNNIPVVIISKSGFFGTIGLSLNPFYGSTEGSFIVSVPEDFAEEATEILNMVIGESWTKKE